MGAEELLAAGESFGPIIDLAASYRAQLERAGFSPTAAESVVVAWLIEMQAAVIRDQAR